MFTAIKLAVNAKLMQNSDLTQESSCDIHSWRIERGGPIDYPCTKELMYGGNCYQNDPFRGKHDAWVANPFRYD